MASVELGLLRTRVVETLHDWQQKMEERGRLLPTYAQVKELRSQIAELERQDAQLSQTLNSRLDQIEKKLGDAYQKRVDAMLDHLDFSHGSDLAWREAVNEARTLITELRRFSPTLIGDRNQQLQDAQCRLEGDRLLEEARRDEIETCARIGGELETEAVASIRLVREARGLVDRVAKRVEEARRKEAPEDLVRQISDIEASSRKYVDGLRTRVADDALTYDLNEEFAEAHQLLLDIKNEDGPTTKVRYHYLVEEEQDGSDQPITLVRGPAQVEVQAAINACEWRWSANLEPRAKRHLDAAEQALQRHDPIKANSELDEVDSVAKGLALERLTGDTRGRLRRLREQCAQDLEAFMAFERGIGKVAELSPGIVAWDSLSELGKQYQHFQVTSNIWQQEHRNAHERVVGDSRLELERIRAMTAAHSLGHGRRQVRGVLDPLVPHADAFPEVYREVTMLSNLIDVLDTRLPEIERKLKDRDLDTAQAELVEIWALLDQAGVGRQSEYQRLMDIRDAFTNADKLLERLRTDARETVSTERLHELASELEDHLQNVPEEFQPDFRSLLEYVQARLNFLFGGQILQVAADYDQAHQHFKEAMKHPEFQDEAGRELAWLESQLIPANEKVRRALDEAGKRVQAGDFWLAYERLQEVSSAPAEKGLRARCQEQLAANREKARMQSRDTLQQALDQDRGQSRELREHARRLRILDAESPVVRDPRLWPLIYRLAGQEALKADDWRTAASCFESAAKAATETSDEGVQASAHRFHLRAKAALKQFILTQNPLLDPSIAVEVVTGKLQRDFRDDADLLFSHSESLERQAQQAEGDWLDTSFGSDSVSADAGADRESESLRTALVLRREAKERAAKAAQNADRWVLPGTAPEYEQERIIMLEADPQEETEGRRQRAADLRKALAQGIELVAAKIYIVDRIP